MFVAAMSASRSIRANAVDALPFTQAECSGVDVCTAIDQGECRRRVAILTSVVQRHFSTAIFCLDVYTATDQRKRNLRLVILASTVKRRSSTDVPGIDVCTAIDESDYISVLRFMRDQCGGVRPYGRSRMNRKTGLSSL